MLYGGWELDRLRTEAKALHPPTGHWSRLVELVGRVADAYDRGREGDHVFFASAGDWAEADLGMTRSQFVECCQLWGVMKQCPAGDWSKISRSNAMLAKKAIGLGAEPAIAMIRAAGTTREMRAWLDSLSAQETWTTFRVRVPASSGMLGTVSAAFQKAAEALQIDLGEARRAFDRDVAFRCLEVICATYVLTPSEVESEG